MMITAAMKRNAQDYYLNHYIESDHGDVLDVVGEDRFRVNVKPSPSGRLALEWEHATISQGTNCLSFAAGRFDLGYSHPDIYDPEFVHYLAQEAKNDNNAQRLQTVFHHSGFVRIREHEISRDRHVIAVAALDDSQGDDFHCYRLMPQGWLHKPGYKPYINTDGSNRIIDNPQTCDRVAYMGFVGYFTIPDEGCRVITTPSPIVLKMMQ